MVLFKSLARKILRHYFEVFLWRHGVIFIKNRTSINVRPYLKSEAGSQVYFSASKGRVFKLNMFSMGEFGEHSLYALIGIFGFYFSVPIHHAFIKLPKNNRRANNGSLVCHAYYRGGAPRFALSPVVNVTAVSGTGERSDGKASILIECTYAYQIAGILDSIELKRRDAELTVPAEVNTTDSGLVLTIDYQQEAFVNDSRWDIVFRPQGKKLGLKLFVQGELEDEAGEEDRYLYQAPINDDTFLSAYLTEGGGSLAFWYIDKERFAEVYEVAEGKTVYAKELAEEVDQNLVIFESFLGKSYAGNPKYIYQYLLENFGDKFTYVWSYNKEEELPGNPIVVKRGSKEYFKHLARAKYWIGNVVFPVHNKRPETVYLQTWHGTPLKRLGFDIDVSGPETLARESFYRESRNWNYLISANNYSSEIFSRAFRFNKKVLEIGYPHNDILVAGKDEEKVAIKNNIGLPQDKKVILYAPTWRDNQSTSAWNFSFGLKIDLLDFHSRLGDEYILLIKTHHLISTLLDCEDLPSSCINVSDLDDVQELSLISDILITDYSSVFYDYAVQKKPVLFYAYDLEEYETEMRGFYVNMTEELPGPVLRTSEQLMDAIENIEDIQAEYDERYQEFDNKYCSLDDGQSSKRAVELVFGDVNG